MKKTLTLLFAAIMLLSACHKKEDSEPEIFNRTVLVYVAGDNDLGGSSGTNFFPSDLRQMKEGTRNLSTNNKLILFVDCFNKRPYFMLVENGDTIRLKTMDKEMKSSDPETLYQAMKYVTDNYPSESYGLVLWGHSDGWITRGAATAVGEDSQSTSASRSPRKSYGVDYTGGYTYMNIPDMAQALSRFPKMKFIFADCCAFLCVENAYELRNRAEYIIGSPAEIPGEGAPYHTVVPAMFSPDDEFYKTLIDAYFAQTSDGNKVPLAAVNCSELDNLAQATATTLATIAKKIEPDNDGCRYPNVEGLIFYYDHTQFDMQDFMLRYASTDQYTEWKKVFDKTVPYHTFAKVWKANHVYFDDFSATEERMGTLGMFVPQRETDTRWWKSTYVIYLDMSMSKMNENIKKMQWYNAARLADIGW